MQWFNAGVTVAEPSLATMITLFFHQMFFACVGAEEFYSIYRRVSRATVSRKDSPS